MKNFVFRSSRFSLYRSTLVIFLTALMIIACNLDPNSTMQGTDCRDISHAMGTTEVCGTPENIVVLGDHSLDLLLSLGEQPDGFASVISLHNGDVFDRPSEQIPYLGQFVTTEPVNLGIASQPSLEVLTQLQPELIVGEVARSRKDYQLLSQIAPTLLWHRRYQPGQWQQNLRSLAQALGKESKAEAALAEVQQQIAITRESLRPVTSTSPQVLIVGANRLASGEMHAVTRHSFLGELMEELGFELVAPKNSTHFAPLSLEALSQLNDADYIFVLGYNFDGALRAQATNPDRIVQQQTSSIQQDWANNAITQSLSATKANRVYFAPYLLWDGLNGPIGIKLTLADLRQSLLE